MKLAIPIENSKENSKLSAVFARSKYFALYDTVNNSIEYIDNPYCDDKMRVGANVVWLLNQSQVNSFVAFEFGLKLQNQASKHKIQLILLKYSFRSLKDLIKLITKS